MREYEHIDSRDGSAPPFRIDSPLHEALMEETPRLPLKPTGQPETFPEPGPAQPGDSNGKEMSQSEYERFQAIRALKCWPMPYLKSRWHRNELKPILSCLFTEWKCNLDCHYCWAQSRHVQGMTEDTAKRSIDWLHAIGCRVLGLMGGEPLLRPDFIHKLIDYSAKKGFYIYLPTNGRPMRPVWIDRFGDAGVATVNLAIDCVEEKPGLPKALTHIRENFEYLLKRQHRYGYCVFLNINIARNNIEDVKELTEIARDYNVITCYHITETPMLEQRAYEHLENNGTFLRPEDYPRVDELLDYLADKNRQGYKMLNPVAGLLQMKNTMRGEIEPWPCRAGQNTLVIRVDGSLAPCFPMYSANYDWGTVEDPKFDSQQLTDMKKTCNKHCFSTTQSIVGYCYNNVRILRWISRQALNGFRGVTGSF